MFDFYYIIYLRNTYHISDNTYIIIFQENEDVYEYESIPAYLPAFQESNPDSFYFSHSLPSGISVGRSNIKQVADKRRADIEKFLVSLFKMAPEISQSDLVYTFFHPLLRDQQNADIRLRKVKGILFGIL